jgi:hypothetical protein
MSTQPKADPQLVEVFGTEQESEAMVVHGLLSSAGIESVVTSVDAPQNIFPGVGGVVVRVNPAQADEARKIIEEYQNAPNLEEVGADESGNDVDEQA